MVFFVIALARTLDDEIFSKTPNMEKKTNQVKTCAMYIFDEIDKKKFVHRLWLEKFHGSSTSSLVSDNLIN